MSVSTDGIASVLTEIRRLQGEAASGAAAPVEGAAGQGEDFGALLRDMVGSVNETQRSANSMRTSYSLGEDKYDLAQVMIAQQQSRVAFEGLLQVRKHLISAYQEIMSMPL
jgi:flagellar hook-basal body complex protein FliE